MVIKHITIIYNPKSSGPAVRAAQTLYAQIRQHLPQSSVETIATKYPTHGADAAEIAGRTRRGAVIVSVGGDGSYHHVINGIMRLPARQRPICAVLPTGNANDHHRETAPDRALLDRLSDGDIRQLDVLKVTVHNPVGDDQRHYAHSYVGFGSTGRVARWLNRNRVGRVAEKFAVARELLRPRQFEVVADGKMKYFYSVICSNITTIAKYVTVSRQGDPGDGKFEVVETPAVSRLRLLKQAARSAAGQSVANKRTSRYSVLLMSNVQAQCDGESMWLPRGATVTVSVQPKALKTLT